MSVENKVTILSEGRGNARRILGVFTNRETIEKWLKGFFSHGKNDLLRLGIWTEEAAIDEAPDGRDLLNDDRVFLQRWSVCWNITSPVPPSICVLRGLFSKHEIGMWGADVEFKDNILYVKSWRGEEHVRDIFDRELVKRGIEAYFNKEKPEVRETDSVYVASQVTSVVNGPSIPPDIEDEFKPTRSTPAPKFFKKSELFYGTCKMRVYISKRGSDSEFEFYRECNTDEEASGVVAHLMVQWPKCKTMITQVDSKLLKV